MIRRAAVEADRSLLTRLGYLAYRAEPSRGNVEKGAGLKLKERRLMADDYIDYLECGEYGDHCVSEASKLVGLSEIVDVEALRTYVKGAVHAVDLELEKVGIKRSSLRDDRKLTQTKTAAGRKEIEKFFNYLGTLDDDVSFDRESFFPGGNLGPLAALKPADVEAKLGAVLRGFAASANSALPERDKWKGKLEKARDELVSSLASKGGTQADSITGTKGLVTARANFLLAYNGVAKPVIEGLLAKLGRRGEMRRFFKDLQVNETAPPKTPQGTEPPPQEPGAESPAPPEKG